MAHASMLRISVLLLSAPVADTTSAVEWEGSQEGRCTSTDYMNIGWGGMSKERCLSRAVEVRTTNGAGCSYVSYSGSSGPVGAGNFCRCHSSCEAPLEQPA